MKHTCALFQITPDVLCFKCIICSESIQILLKVLGFIVPNILCPCIVLWGFKEALLLLNCCSHFEHNCVDPENFCIKLNFLIGQWMSNYSLNRI